MVEIDRRRPLIISKQPTGTTRPVMEFEDTPIKYEPWYMMLAGSILDGIYIIDTNGRFTFVNDVIAERSALLY